MTNERNVISTYEIKGGGFTSEMLELSTRKDHPLKTTSLFKVNNDMSLNVGD